MMPPISSSVPGCGRRGHPSQGSKLELSKVYGLSLSYLCVGRISDGVSGNSTTYGTIRNLSIMASSYQSKNLHYTAIEQPFVLHPSPYPDSAGSLNVLD